MIDARTPTQRPHPAKPVKEVAGKAPEIVYIATPPVPARIFADLLPLSDDDLELPADPYYNYPFEGASSISEYVVFSVIRDSELYDEYYGKEFDDIEDDIREAARLLGKKYAIWLTEEGDGTWDIVVFTDRREVVEEARRLARKLDEIISRYDDEWEHQDEIIAELEKVA